MKKFLAELPKNFKEIGQVVPSSRVLAKTLTRSMKHGMAPRRILEVGPGTGSVTRELLKTLIPGDKLVVCEINVRLLEALRNRLVHLSEYQRHSHQIVFLGLPVQELRRRERTHSFDCIVSSLPFTNFTPSMVREVLDLYEWLLKPGGTLTFYEYLGLRRAGQVFRKEHERERVRGVERVIDEWKRERARRGGLKTEVTLLNMPPARTVEARF